MKRFERLDGLDFQVHRGRNCTQGAASVLTAATSHTTAVSDQAPGSGFDRRHPSGSERPSTTTPGRVLIVEGVLLRDGRRDLTSMLDLEMLVLCGPGRERTKPELRRLFSAAGLELLANHPLTETGHLFVTRPRSRRGADPTRG